MPKQTTATGDSCVKEMARRLIHLSPVLLHSCPCVSSFFVCSVLQAALVASFHLVIGLFILGSQLLIIVPSSFFELICAYKMPGVLVLAPVLLMNFVKFLVLTSILSEPSSEINLNSTPFWHCSGYIVQPRLSNLEKPVF